MFDFFGRLFGSEKAVSKAVDGVYNGIDKMFYTDEEKAQDGARDRAEARTMLLEWVKNSQGANLARRFIAVTVTLIWALQYVVSMVMSGLAPWMTDYTERLNESSLIIASNGESVTGAMMLVLGFYFAAPYLGSVVDGAMSKFGGNKKVS